MQPEVAWVVSDLGFRYRGAPQRAVDGVSLTIQRGELVAILGPNGAGKSTLLHLLIGTLPSDQGVIDFEGRPIASWPRRALARRIGVVLQSEDATFPMTTRTLVAMGRYPHLASWEAEGDVDGATIAWAMDRAGLDTLGERPLGSLSGGERQRARVARALAQCPAAFALDEPTASLDVHHEMALFALFRELASEGRTVLLTTHNLNLAARFADRLVLLDTGRVIADGSPAEVIIQPTIEQTYRWPARIVGHPGPGPDAGAPQVVPLASHAHQRTERPMRHLDSRALTIIAATLLAATSGPSGAQATRRDSTGADSATAQRLTPIVTTATRTPARITELPQRVEAISRADIERTAARDVVDVLKKTAAVDVIQYPSLSAGVGIRGFRPQTGGINQRTMILIDGRPAGAFNLALIDLETVERIEVLKGPASALYGSNAMGGVVNLLTHRSDGRPSGSLSAAAGSFGLAEYALRAGGKLRGPLDGDLSLRLHQQGDTYRIGNGNLFRDLLGAENARKRYPLGDKPDRDVSDTLGDGASHGFSGFQTRAGSVRLGYAVREQVRLDVRGELFDADNVLTPGDIYAQATSPGHARKNVARQSLDASVSARTGGHDLLARAFTAKETGENFDRADAGRFINFSSESTTGGGQLQDRIALGALALTIGADLTVVQAVSRRYSGPGTEIGTFSPNSGVRSAAAFAQLQWRAAGGRLTGTGGLRADRITLEVGETALRPDVTPGRERFGVINPNVGAQWLAGGGVRLHATAGSAFVAPDAFNRAGFAESIAGSVASFTVGNPEVDPERSVTIDAGVGIVRPQRGLEADVTYFSTTVADRITRARASFAAGRRPTTSGGLAVGRVETSVNAGDARIQGVEARAAYDLGLAWRRVYSVRVYANATRIIRAEERTPTVTIDTARFAAVTNFDARRVFGAFVFGPLGDPTRVRNVADLTVTSGVEYDDDRRLTLRVGARYVGSRLDSDFTDAADVSDIEYPPFLVADVVGSLRVTRMLRAELTVSNLTDENYYEKRGYNLAGRALQLRLRADW